jgi:2-polyprenyl-6-methoxyphenol hydroxylase-like FAD-dependent oxidoreductase
VGYDSLMSHVVIVGAGPAGASLALLLSSRGVDVTLLERRRDFSREFRGEILMPSGMTALEQMGLGTQLPPVPMHRVQSVDVFMNGARIFGLDPRSFENTQVNAVSQTALLEMLVDQAGAHNTFRFERGASLQGFLMDSSRVVGVRAKLEEGEVEIRADLVVGADGRNSMVRRVLGLKLRHVSPPMDIVWFKVPCPEELDGARVYLGRGHLLFAYRTWDGTLQLGWVILKGTFGDLRSRGIDQWLDEMTKHVSTDLAEHLLAHRSQIGHPFLLDVVSDCVESWCSPGAVVIGDAAHAMSPVGAQGINIALRDSVVAANHLVPLLDGSAVEPEALDAALKQIEAERMREVGPIQSLQARPPKLILSQSWWGEPTRRIFAKLLSSERVRSRAGSQISAFPFGITDVKLEV